MEKDTSIIYFKTPTEFRAWLADNHAAEKALWVGYYKKATKIPTQTWSESVDQALCFGWIDGIRKSVDDKRYKIRFTPRRPKSIWSPTNLKKVPELIRQNLMQPSGMALYNIRDEEKSNAFYDRSNLIMPDAFLKELKANPTAFIFYEKLSPSVKFNTIAWVIRAKQEKTRLKRLKILIESCEQGLKVPPFRRKLKK